MRTATRFATITDTADKIWQGLERTLLAAVERFNPILIKETRQALKSRQFVLTFMLTLLACWIATFALFAIVGPEVFFVASGDQMLFVYCAILAFPLMVVVPYSAYRSIASEQEDKTYDLLSITSLTARQIVTGKLGSALVQMLVYLSAVSPCIAFTFLLRGVDLLVVVLVLVAYFLVSLGTSMIALLIGTTSKIRYTQSLTSVLVVIALFTTFSPGLALTYGFIEESDYFIRESEFWYGVAAALTFYVTQFLLLHAAAAAQIAFPSENRSTPLRWRMLLQQACFLGWLAVLPVVESDPAVMFITAMIAVGVAAIYWFGMGTLLTSEWPHLSRRVQRSLPQSRLGQMFLTWLNPGPGTGFMFAVANLSAVALAALVLINSVGPATPAFFNLSQAYYFVGFAWCYVVIFLGVGNLCISLLRRFFFISLTAGFLLHAVLLLLSCGIPQVVTFMSNAFGRGDTYSLLHATNPIWTLMRVADSRGFPSSPEAGVLVVLLPAAAAIVLLINMRLVAAELLLRRCHLPTRVAEEEAELHPTRPSVPSNPWDVPVEETP